MRNQAVARRYAQALFSLAAERDELDELEAELGKALEIISEEPELRAVLENQRVRESRKEQLLQQVFGDALSPLALNFLRLLVSKHREEYLEDIFREFRDYADGARGIERARVTLATELDGETKETIRQGLMELTGKDIRMTTAVDPDIIGGLMVHIGDLRYDASLRTQLRKLETVLKGQGEKRKGVTTE